MTTATPSSTPIKFANGTEIDLLTHDGEFVGLGQVSVHGVPLRSGRRPIKVFLDTPTGILYTRLLVEEVESSPEGAKIQLRAVGTHWDQSEFHDDYGQSITWLHDQDGSVEDRLTLVVKSDTVTLGGQSWSGFSYRWCFSSSEREIHHIRTHATWEIGGSISGNTVLSQGQCNMPVYRGSREQLFTTACLRTLDKYGSPQGNSFQLGPRAGLIQGFDFQHSDLGVLFQYWPEFKSISSLVESPPGSDLLHMIDDYRFELTSEIDTTPKRVLFNPQRLEEHEARDLWWECLEHVYGGIRDQFGVTRTVSVPELMMSYSTVLDGQEAKQVPGYAGWAVTQAEGASQSGLRMKLGEVEVHHTEVLYAAADHLLPRLAEQGIRRFWPDAISESDVTETGMKRKLEEGVHGELHCASINATHRFFPSEYWGGIKAWRYLYEKAQSLNMELGHWFAPHFSPRSPYYTANPEYYMINSSGFPAGGGYGFHSIVAGDWNTGIYQKTLDDLKRWKEEGGLDYLFIDSYSNMGMVQMNYSARMRTNYEAFARLLADLQKIGIRAFSFECISPLGLGHFGASDLRGDLMDQNHAVAGQNDFGWWVGEEDMALDCYLAVVPRKREEEELQRIQFRTMANRGYICWQGLYDLSHIMPEWWARANKVYNQVVPHMNKRRMLPNRGGVSWLDGDIELLWLYAEQSISTGENQDIERATEDGFQPLPQGTRQLAPWQVYRIRRA